MYTLRVFWKVLKSQFVVDRYVPVIILLCDTSNEMVQVIHILKIGVIVIFLQVIHYANEILLMGPSALERSFPTFQCSSSVAFYN